jgi:hypothetical protein
MLAFLLSSRLCSGAGGASEGRGGRTSLLQKNRLVGKHPALVPGHAIPQLIDAHLLTPQALPHARRRDLGLAAIGQRHADHGPPPPPLPRAHPGAHLVPVLVVVLEEARAVRRRRRVLHLHREPAAREHAVALPERVRDLVDVDRVERHPDAHARVLGRVLDQDELALLAVGQVAEERHAVAGDGGARAGFRGVREGHGAVGVVRVVHGGRHGGVGGARGRGVGGLVGREGVCLADVVWGGSLLLDGVCRGGLLVVVVSVGVLIVT